MCSVKTGKKIGDYTVASCIGKGRYGVCFLALDPDGKKVILKKFRTRMWKKNKNANHYEAVILSGLEHPAVPELLGVINNRQGYYFVLEYKEGLTLEQWLFDRKKIFTSGEIYRIGFRTCPICGRGEYQIQPGLCACRKCDPVSAVFRI